MSNAPRALIVDDDPDFCALLRVILKQAGVESVSTPSPDEFLALVDNTKFDAFFIDLNIGELMLGYSLVESVRDRAGIVAPVFVVSALSDNQSIAHALEIGATDFFVKPVDKDILATKLKRYVSSDKLKNSGLSPFPVPSGGVSAALDLEIEVESVDEFGVRMTGKHLLSKGTVVSMSGAFVKTVTEQNIAVMARVTSTWVTKSENENTYGAYAEFEASQDVMMAIRRWLTQKN